MATVDLELKMRRLCFPLRTILLVFVAVPASGFNIVAEGSSATERTTDISLRCHAIGLTSEDEVVRVTWFAIDQSQRFLSEVFSADLTNDRPAFHFSGDWAGRGVYDSSTMADVRLPARFVSRDFAGKYRCQVDSLMTSRFADVKVNVLYGPGSSMIISPGGRVDRPEGQQLSLTCLAQCNPECSYRWYKAGRLVSSSGTMKMASLSRDQAGLYACQARNEAGRSIKPVDLRISFPASVLNLNINSEGTEPSRGRNIQGYGVEEGIQTVVFTCKVAAWPEPNIEWSTSNSYSNTANKTRIISTAEVGLELKSSVYEIKSATCRDNGQYTCRAHNSIGEPSFRSGLLNISCAPFETNQSDSCLKDSDTTIIKNLHMNLYINLCFFGNPVPVVTMTHLNNKNGVMTIYTGNTSCDFKLNLCDSIFEFNITSPDQYGDYIVKVINSQGHFEKRFIVFSQQPPLAPFMFSVSNISDSSACLSWNSNFNGGAKQIFSLKVNTATRQKAEDQTREFYIEEGDATSSSKYSQCIFNLLPETRYDAILLTENKFGVSESLRRVAFATITSFNSTIPIPSWLSVVQTTVIGYSDKQATISPREKVGNLMFKEQPIEKLRNSHYDTLKVAAAEIQHKAEDSKMNMPGFVDTRGKQFFQLLDVYFTFNKLASGKRLKLWLKEDPSRSNSSSPLDGWFSHNARAQDGRFGVASSLYPTTVFGLSNETTSSIIDSTSLAEHTSALSSLSPVMLSIIGIGITCVVGIILSFACITVIRRQQIKSQCNRKHGRRDVGKHLRKPTAANESQLQMVSHNQRNINGVLLERVPSITCVYNENAFFPPCTVRRPRLSTPDINLQRQKETTVDASDGKKQHSLTSHSVSLGRVPFISVDNVHGSCSSYLDLVQTEIKAYPANSRPNQSLQDHGMFPDRKQLQHHSSSSHLFPFSSLQQTHVKSLSHEEPEVSSSYIDLYETLAARSRSRSPSNIYNPLFFDDPSTDPDEGIQNNESNKDRATVVKETDNPSTINPSSDHPAKFKDQNHLNKSIQVCPDWVQCRPKKTSLRAKLTRAPSGPQASSGAVSESSYELVNVSSRKHLASHMYLPMVSNVNCAYHESNTLRNYNPPDIDNTYEKPQCTAVFQSGRIPELSTRNEDSTYKSRIPAETTQNDSENPPDVYSSHYQHYIDIDELSRRRNVTTHAFISQRDRVVTSSKSLYNDISVLDNTHLQYKTTTTCVSQKENSHKGFYEGEDYVQEDTLSYINRDSVSSISTTGTMSTYCNDPDFRHSLQCCSGSDLDEPRSRKSSSESDRGIKCSRKFSFDSDSTDHCFDDPLFEFSGDAFPNSRKASEDTCRDRRDSGVFFNCPPERICHGSGSKQMQDSAKRNLPGLSVFCQQPDSEQDLYEEPVVNEHIYAEVAS